MESRVVDDLSLAALVVGSAALVESVAIERFKKPRLEIAPVIWQATGPVYPMTFAQAQVKNKPLPRPLPVVLNQHAAEACEVIISFFTWGDKASRRPFIEPIKGRWDNLREPFQIVPIDPPRRSRRRSTPVPGQAVQQSGSGAGTAPTIGTLGPPGQPAGGTGAMPPGSSGTVPVSSAGTVSTSSSGVYPFEPLRGTTDAQEWEARYEPSRIIFQQDISPGFEYAKVSVAILRDGTAYAFANESYENPYDQRKPGWQLELGATYRVEIEVRGSNVRDTEVFMLPYLNNNFNDFRLRPVKGAAAR
jgi:hypothetical protein